MRSIFKWLQKIGADSFEPLENDVTLALPQYADPSVVTAAMDANAATSQISSYAFPNTDFESVCQAIYQNKAVLLLIKCDEGFWGTATPTFTTPKYGHFIVAFDYDETQGFVRVIDSADPSDALAIKKVGKQYFQPQFILEAGTALELPPSVHQALTTNQVSLAQQILARHREDSPPRPDPFPEKGRNLLIDPMTSINATVLTAGVGLIGLGVNTIATNLLAGAIQIALGIVAIIVYEKLPASPTS